MNNSNQSSEKHITLGYIIGWVLGVFVGIPGIMTLFSKPIAGISFLIIAAILLPPVNKIIKEKYNFSLSVGLKIIAIIVLLIIAGMQENFNSGSSSIKEMANNAQVEAAKEYQKVFTFSGNGIKKSEPFTISGDRFKISYDCTGDYCGASVYKVGSSFPQGIMNNAGSIKDETIIYTSTTGKGDYYIDANSMGNFTIIVYDYK